MTKLVALLFATALVAAACGDSDDGAAGPVDGDGTSDTVAPGGDDEVDGEPVSGGRLVYAVDSDTANAWAPYRASYAISGYVVLQSISDPLFFADADGEWAPFLAESMEPNDDYTAWTLTVRDGITFHDGTPLDGEAVKVNLETCMGSPLTASALSNIAGVEADGQTVTIPTATPWVALPVVLAGGSCSYMLSPDWLLSLPDVPHRTEGNPFYDAELAATPANGDPAAPVGLGAFEYQSYTPGNGNSFVAVRNDDYWRGPNGTTGEDLPYLDEIEIVAVVDIDSRSNGLRSGQFDIIHTANSDEIAQFQDDDRYETIASSAFGETGYVMLNVAQGSNLMTGAELDPEGANAENPLTTLACRKALAHAIDRDRLQEERGAGIVEPANGPFPPGTIGHLEDSGYPDYDPDAASAEMETCLAERGVEAIQFAFNTTNDPFNVETNQLVISMWQEVFGDQVQATITPVEQGQYIGLGLTGNFDALAWRSHGGFDPDQQFLWWISAAASPIGELALNFGRMSDPVIDENLITLRTNPDADTRREAAESINRRFGEQVYNWWLSWSLWGIVSEPSVNGVTAAELPDGQAMLPILSGRHGMSQLWCTDGTCGS
jgi:peptide/nickel transport system substrate-binding protein